MVVWNKPSIEVREPQEGLYIADLPGFGPVQDRLDLRLRHRKSGGRENVAEVLDGVGVELALVRAGIEPVLAEASEYLFDVLAVLLGVVGVDEDVVEAGDGP